MNLNNRRFRRGFTLIELIIVIAIIGVLAAILMSSFSGGTESARAAKCLSNMRSLAQGAISHAVKTHYYPVAGSYGLLGVNNSGDTVYYERPGWISWFGQNDPYATRTSNKARPKNFIALNNVSAYCSDDDRANFAITNGTLWQAVNREHDVYICPSHKLKASAKGVTVRWSYVMSAAFGYDYSDGSKAVGLMSNEDGNRVHFQSGRLDRKLLFAELPINGSGSRIDEGGKDATYPTGDGDTSCDCVLQYKANYNGKSYNNDWGKKSELIAFNHRAAKQWCAHVVFADGHTEKLLKSKGGGLTDEQLTALLCAGVDVSFDGSKYDLITKGDG